jgi:hypothetical protein
LLARTPTPIIVSRLDDGRLIQGFQPYCSENPVTIEPYREQTQVILGEIMATNDSCTIHRDANGDPDVRFYMARAHEMRGQAIRDGVVAMSKWIRGWLAHHPLPHFPTTLAHH